MNPSVDSYIKEAKNWKPEMELLRAILLDAGLNEELKWRQPCYTYNEGNIAIIQVQRLRRLDVFKGALLKDPKGFLVFPGENSQAAKRIEFTSTQEITKAKTVLKNFIKQAVEAEKAGLKVELKKDVKLVEELEARLAKNKKLKNAFESLTPGRQRAYNLYISGAKQTKTREARIDKVVPRILAGKGL